VKGIETNMAYLICFVRSSSSLEDTHVEKPTSVEDGGIHTLDGNDPEGHTSRFIERLEVVNH
jgi:hypothetical protein